MVLIHQAHERDPGALVPRRGRRQALGILGRGDDDEVLVLKRCVNCLPT